MMKLGDAGILKQSGIASSPSPPPAPPPPPPPPPPRTAKFALPITHFSPFPIPPSSLFHIIPPLVSYHLSLVSVHPPNPLRTPIFLLLLLSLFPRCFTISPPPLSVHACIHAYISEPLYSVFSNHLMHTLLCPPIRPHIFINHTPEMSTATLVYRHDGEIEVGRHRVQLAALEGVSGSSIVYSGCWNSGSFQLLGRNVQLTAP